MVYTARVVDHRLKNKKMKEKTLVITRKIQVIINGKDNLRTLYAWRDARRRGANTVVAHQFCQDNIKDFIYIKDDVKDKIYVQDIMQKGKGMSETNATYRVLSERLKGSVPSAMYSALNNVICKTYAQVDRRDVYTGKAQLRTYKNNIPMPFTKVVLSSIKPIEKEITTKSGETKTIKTYSMNFYGLPLEFFFGRDRSNNRLIVERCLDGVYSFCDSSIQIDDKTKKIFLLLSVKMPIKNIELNPEKELVGVLSLSTPIVAVIGDKCVAEIGDKESFLYKRLQMQESRKRLQKAMKYNKGGKGRKKKLSRLDTLEKAEFNYIQTQLHTYSKELVSVAIANNCGVIRLANPSAEDVARIKLNQSEGDDFVFRNWGWSGLSDLIQYKANKSGIKLVLPYEPPTLEVVEKAIVKMGGTEVLAREFYESCVSCGWENEDGRWLTDWKKSAKIFLSSLT